MSPLYPQPLVRDQAGILANGTFGLWLRGTSFNTSGKGPDPWQREINGTSTMTVSQGSGIFPAGSVDSLQSAYVQGTQTSRVFQAYQDWHQAAGKTVTFRAYVQTSTASAVRLGIYDGVTRTYGSYHPGDGATHQLIVQAVINASPTLLNFEMWNEATGTHIIDAADAFPFAVGLANPEFWETTPYVAKFETLKYYQQIPIDLSLYADRNNQTFTLKVPFLRDMYGTPSVSTFTTGTRTNVNTITYAVTNSYGGTITLVSQDPGDVVVSGDVIALESYP